MGLRILVIEGNTRAARTAHALTYGLTPSDSYAATLRTLAPDLVCDIAFPADPGANLPDPAGLEGYDGVVLTGSALHLYRGGPEVTAQIELMRAVYKSRVPAFGSCWGLQIGAAAAGGEVRANERGREIGFARNIAPTQAGREHPMLAGRPAAWDAPAIHLDVVAMPPGECTVLAANALTPMQAAEIRHDGGTFWGVQYHPEFSLAEVAAILGRMRDVLVAEGFAADANAADTHIAEIAALDAEPARTDLAWKLGLDEQVLDPRLRLTEIANFLERRVRPEASRRSRA